MYTVAFIGTGPNPDAPVWGESAAMAYQHAEGYDRLENCTLVACADIVRDHALEFAERYDISEEHVYEDYTEMLAAVEPDFVSISTPVPTHADIVVDCIESGNVGAIHCEKPMATTFGDSRRMARAADEHDVQLTFNHQRRFGDDRQSVKALLDEGAIGEITRVEMGGPNIYDYGSHLIDLCNFFLEEEDIEWVIGQVEYREENVRYGAHNENQALAQWKYENGVHCLASTGDNSMVTCENRLVGTDGEIEMLPADGPKVRIREHGGEWEAVEVEDNRAISACIEHIVDSYDQGTVPLVSADKALRATEVIFAIWESARRRGRIDLPLGTDDNALEAMVEDGTFTPTS